MISLWYFYTYIQYLDQTQRSYYFLLFQTGSHVAQTHPKLMTRQLRLMLSR